MRDRPNRRASLGSAFPLRLLLVATLPPSAVHAQGVTADYMALVLKLLTDQIAAIRASARRGTCLSTRVDAFRVGWRLLRTAGTHAAFG